MKKQYQLALAFIGLLFSTHALSNDQGAIGVWQTESSDKGYLHVNIEQCDDMLCGTIVNAFNLEDVITEDYEHKGKKMVWNMKAKTDTSWSGGKIWDPSADKTYKSKMSVNGDVLSVSGCVLMFCKAQKWNKVK